MSQLALASDGPVQACGRVLPQYGQVSCCHSPSLLEPSLLQLHVSARAGRTPRNGTRITLGYRSPINQMARLDAMVDAGLDLFIPSEIDMDIDGMAVVTPLST